MLKNSIVILFFVLSLFPHQLHAAVESSFPTPVIRYSGNELFLNYEVTGAEYVEVSYRYRDATERTIVRFNGEDGIVDISTVFANADEIRLNSFLVVIVVSTSETYHEIPTLSYAEHFYITVVLNES